MSSNNLNKNLNKFGVLYVTPGGLQFKSEEFAQKYVSKYGGTYSKKVKAKRTKKTNSKNTLKNGTK